MVRDVEALLGSLEEIVGEHAVRLPPLPQPDSVETEARHPEPRRAAVWVAATTLVVPVAVGGAVYGQVGISMWLVVSALLAGLLALPLASSLPAFAAPVRGALVTVAAPVLAWLLQSSIEHSMHGDFANLLELAIWPCLGYWSTVRGLVEITLFAASGVALGRKSARAAGDQAAHRP
jgi:Ca2+/Na+ antiporter